MLRSAFSLSTIASNGVKATISKRCISSASFELSEYKYHNLPEGSIVSSVEASKEELLGMYETMFNIRRMEITCDTEYKARNIRGFCHLYDGQEAVGVGCNEGLEASDGWITSYRCHAAQYLRNGNVMEQVFGELFGKSTGCSKGKGGSMHMYSKEGKFYGGQGIVGAQVPLGVGIAFANKYNAKLEGRKDMDCAISMYGDGAANQGQIWEAANIASLWKLPAIFCIENNQYGMGTSKNRSSSNTKYYTMGNQIPGIWVDGMDVLSAREAFRFARKWCSEGNGPIYLEMDTYRYHGHSMSDPGITYRDREEINKVRESSDCIKKLKGKILDSGLATEDEIKEIEKRVRKGVGAALKIAKDAPFPDDMQTYSDIYYNEIPAFIRGRDVTESLGDQLN